MLRVTLIIPVRNRQDRIGSAVNDFFDHRYQHCIVSRVIVVDNGSTDDTPNVVTRLQSRHIGLELVSLPEPLGLGAFLRNHQFSEEFVAYATLDYPYRPADLDLLMERAGKTIDVFGTQHPISAVNGCRTGLPMPAFWKFVGRLYRNGLRIAMGHKPEPLAGWLGLRNHWRSWWYWLTMGVPVVDVTSGLKVIDAKLLERFQIQSNGDFAHAEILAKLSFLGTLIAEVPLPPRTAPIPPAEFNEFSTVFRNAKFHAPAKASEPESAPCPPV